MKTNTQIKMKKQQTPGASGQLHGRVIFRALSWALAMQGNLKSNNKQQKVLTF